MALFETTTDRSFSFTHPQAAEVIAGVDPQELGNIPDLYEMLQEPNQSWTIDRDHTYTDSKVLRTGVSPDQPGFFDPQLFYQAGDLATLRNIDQIAIKALLGHSQHICTGKDWNFWPEAQYIMHRIEYIAKKLHMTERTPDGVLRSYLHPERGIFFAGSTGNGALTIDITRGELLVLKPIPLNAWLHMAEAAPLLRRSTKAERLDMIANRIQSHTIYDRNSDPFFRTSGYVTPVEHTIDTSPLTEETFFREIAPMWTKVEREHLNRLQNAMGDHAVFIPELSTKVNYVLKIDEIIHDQKPGGLHEAWFQATGMHVKDFASFMKAFKTFSAGWGVTVNFNEAHGTVYVDIAAPWVDKGLSQRLVKKAFQYHVQKDMGVSAIPKIHSFSLADNNNPELSNDSKILYRLHGVLIGNPSTKYPRTDELYPVYTQDIYGPIDPMEQANRYLFESTLLSCPPEVRPIIEQLVADLNTEHFSLAEASGGILLQ